MDEWQMIFSLIPSKSMTDPARETGGT